MLLCVGLEEEENGLRIFENTALRGLFGSETA
jgi:hypothetical protein